MNAIRVFQVYSEIEGGRFSAGEIKGAPTIPCVIEDERIIKIQATSQRYELIGIYDAQKVPSDFCGEMEIPYVWNTVDVNGRKERVLSLITDVMKKGVNTSDMKFADFIIISLVEQ